ncbi:MAG: hypothetical protein R2734_20835 [Nocardioides sp.]
MVYAVESGAIDKLLASGVVSAEALPRSSCSPGAWPRAASTSTAGPSRWAAR